jgi:alpha-tubulin suppressor-like RCC1 family protein
VSVRNLGGALCVAFALCAPPAASAPPVVDGIAAGGGISCAVTTTNDPKCWGWNYYGQLGVGTNLGPQICGPNTHNPVACSTTPVAVGGLGGAVEAMTAGHAHTCALTTAGGVRCWGAAGAGQLGNGNTTGSQVCGAGFEPCTPSPVAVHELNSGVAAVEAGWGHTCALTDDGGVECWGANGGGQLGDGTTTHRSIPVDVELPPGMTATAIAGGGDHTCAVTGAGGVECWGLNQQGQLGIGTDAGPQTCTNHELACSTSPLAVDLPSGVTATAVTAGASHTCALTSAGGVLCWGGNRGGQLGDGTTADSSSPVAVSGLGGPVVAIASHAAHTCALTSAGGVECWGENFGGKLGAGTWTGPEQCGPSGFPCSTVPVQVIGLDSGVAAVAVGGGHTCAMTAIGGVLCWGDNSSGELGVGTKEGHPSPVTVSGLPGVWELSVSPAGAGSGVVASSPAGIDCGGPGHTACSAPFAAGSTVLLSATGGAGSAPVGFTGGGCGTAMSTCAVTMSSARSVTATFALPPSASISAPAGGGTYAVGESVPTSFSCVEGASGPGLASCDDSRGARTSSGGSGSLDTSTAGLHVYTVTAVSTDGLTDSESIAYRVAPEGEPPSGPQGPEGPQPTPPEPRLELSLRVGTESLRKLLRTGKLVVAATVNEAAKVALNGRAKLRAHARRNAWTKLVPVFKTETVRFVAPGERSVTLTLSRKGRRALRGLRQVKLAIAGSATDAAGEAATERVALTLRR